MTQNPNENFSENFTKQEAAWQEQGFILYQTKDGSPTLKKEQSMHHSGGALAETRYIYEEVLLRAKTHIQRPKALVVGLGMGYIEAFILQHYFYDPLWNHSGHIHSYESSEFLRDVFLASYGIKTLAPSPCIDTTNEVRGLVQSDMESISIYFQKLQTEKRLILSAELNTDSLPQEKCNMIFYDAYSSGASPELWSEEFLKSFLDQACEDTCFFSTYACTSVLKRSLTDQGFQVEVRPGFVGKRDCTFAIRGL